MPGAPAGHTATLLQNGQVLLAGGMPSGSNSAQLYDPTTDSFSLTGSMASGREFFTATLLPNGKVLVAGGWNGTELASCELYDPNDGTFRDRKSTRLKSSHF